MTRRARQLRRHVVVPDELKGERVVVAAGLLLISLQLALRAWALYPSWFFADDFRLLYDAKHAGLTLGYLNRPFDSQFMPLGRLIAWLVAHNGSLNWPLAATITLTLQFIASACCLWMLTRLFTARWAILAPLSVYLFTAVTIPAMMWWAASLNQLPLQAVMFAAFTLGIEYLRRRRLSLLAATLFVIGIGLLAYVKALLILLVLAFLALAYFSEGSALRRLRTVWFKFWPAVVASVALGFAYIAYYLMFVPQPFEVGRGKVPSDLADTMLGTAFSTGVLGGPWSWWETNPPLVLAQPPSWSVHLAWSVCVLIILYAFLRRQRTLRAWALLGGYLVTLLVLLMTSRGVLFGRIAGLDYRYLTDAIPILVVTVGLAFMPLLGSTECSEARQPPYLLLRAGPRTTLGLVAAIALGGLVSSIMYVGYWHEDNRAADYLRRTSADLSRRQEVVHLAEQVLPANVMPDYTKPYNRASRMVTLLRGRATFPETTDRLTVLGEDGGLYRAAINKGIDGEPGPVTNCGWKVDAGGAAIPLQHETLNWTWWVRIGYLSSQASPVVVSAGGTALDARVLPGVNSLYVRLEGKFDEINLSGLRAGTIMCVDAVEVGSPAPGAPL